MSKEPFYDLKRQILVCPTCNDSEEVKFPIPVNEMADMLKSFSKKHKKCPKPLCGQRDCESNGACVSGECDD